MQRSALPGSGSNVGPERFLWRQSISFVNRDQRIFLRFGLLPVVWDSTAKDETLAAYTKLHLKEEIQAEALVRNLPGFGRFLPLAAIFHGQTVNVTSIARDGEDDGSGKVEAWGDLPPADEVQKQIESGSHIQRVAFSTEGLTDWGSGLLAFLIKVIRQCNRKKIRVEKAGLPKGALSLISMLVGLKELSKGEVIYD